MFDLDFQGHAIKIELFHYHRWIPWPRKHTHEKYFQKIRTGRQKSRGVASTPLLGVFGWRNTLGICGLIESSTYIIVEVSRKITRILAAVETLGPICSDGAEFITELGHRIASVSGDPRDTAFLFQRISIAVQRGNAASVLVPLMLVSDSD